MALQLTIANPYTANASYTNAYHRITHVAVDFQGRVITITVASYVSRTDYLAGTARVRVTEHHFRDTEYTTIATAIAAGNPLMPVLYTALKTLGEWETATDAAE